MYHLPHAGALHLTSPLAALALSCSAPAGGFAAPHITSVTIVPSDLRSGDRVTATVLTTGDTIGVVAHVRRHDITVPRVQDGVYSGSAVVPHIPRFIHFHVRVTFEALGPEGTSDEKVMSVKIN